MATHQDIIRRTLVRMETIRPGQDVPGRLYSDVLACLQDVLLEVNEYYPLDFDPTDSSDVPDERVPSVANLLRYSPHLDFLDTKYGPADRSQLYERARAELARYLVGDSDFLDVEVRDF